MFPATSRLSSGWIPRSQQPRPNCPPGLENLLPLDFFWIQQAMEVVEMISGVETENKYYVKTHSGQNLFYGMEKSSYCARNCGCCGCRPFQMKISDYSGAEVIHLDRPCVCCYDEIHVFSPPQVHVGSVHQRCGFCRPAFSLLDTAREEILSLRGPFRLCGCCFSGCCGRNLDFRLFDADGTRVGKISRQWLGRQRDRITDADMFGVSFPQDLDVRMKAVLVGACILIDMVYFEDKPKKTNLRPNVNPRMMY